MSKEILINAQTGNVVEKELTTEELNQLETTNNELITAKETAEQAQADLKASAKAKLMSGEALTEEEANTIVL